MEVAGKDTDKDGSPGVLTKYVTRGFLSSSTCATSSITMSETVSFSFGLRVLRMVSKSVFSVLCDPPDSAFLIASVISTHFTAAICEHLSTLQR